jgi:hypothetical protein
MNARKTLICLAWLWLAGSCLDAASGAAFVRISPRDPRYFELSDGRPYIPNGLNLIHPNTADRDGLARMEEWVQRLGTNGGNFARVWLSSPFWDVEHERSGVYDEAKAQRIDALLEMARRNGIYVKMTLEHFREMSDNPRQRWANKPLHLVSNGGTATNVADFFSGSASRKRFKQKIAWFARRYPNNSEIFGWELWNEVNAVATGPEHFMPWTELMLAELRREFPLHLVMQSLGSFDTARVRELYRRHSLLPGNDLAQVHRYLDLGASLEVCQGPMDVLSADSVSELLSYGVNKPVILAEGGAVEPRHTGPFKLYAKDKAGIILHDVLFAPFFAGAAGSGQIWHWDRYVDGNNLWHHFARFAEAVKDLDPPGENFQPLELQHPRLRIYALKGKRIVLLWCRDPRNTWQTELEQDRAPETLRDIRLDVSELFDENAPVRAQAYDPWQNRWMELPGEKIVVLPEFSRSIVVRLAVEP